MSVFKALCFLLLGLLSTTPTQAQRTFTVFAKAANFESFEGKNMQELRIERRSTEEIYKSGGSDFKITSKDRFHKRFLKRGAFLVQSGDSLYVNCYLFGKGMWYSRAHRLDNQLIFLAPVTDRKPKETATLLVKGREIKAGNLSRGAASLRRCHYTYDLSTGRLDRLTREKMVAILEAYPTLADRYKSERQPNTPYTVKKYAHAYRDLSEAAHAFTDKDAGNGAEREGTGGR